MNSLNEWCSFGSVPVLFPDDQSLMYNHYLICDVDSSNFCKPSLTQMVGFDLRI